MTVIKNYPNNSILLQNNNLKIEKKFKNVSMFQLPSS